MADRLRAPSPTGCSPGSDLFSAIGLETRIALGPQAVLLRGWALAQSGSEGLLDTVAELLAHTPLRSMRTPGGHTMSVQTSSCGALGWVSSEHGYRYCATDPLNARPWAALPAHLHALAAQAAAEAGFTTFSPDSCLINEYRAGSKMGLHQDRNEADFNHPIVSVSLGMAAVFLWGGLRRSDTVRQIALHHGDVVVWGGADRLRFHGVKGLSGAPHPALGPRRINLTLRRAGR